MTLPLDSINPQCIFYSVGGSTPGGVQLLSTLNIIPIPQKQEVKGVSPGEVHPTIVVRPIPAVGCITHKSIATSPIVKKTPNTGVSM